jgi:hypothetical protein
MGKIRGGVLEPGRRAPGVLSVGTGSCAYVRPSLPRRAARRPTPANLRPSGHDGPKAARGDS